ncbi:hypothetical protein SAMN05720781_1626 [Fibrobacter sp. UWT3]|uniref:hypothetical protein n=1 Tax=Fibrobacter sp. UWT3 TaxID=1896225 RepID=UPI000BD5E448|nr:hypothetical protein [Fibrobacter sp. UWT3]SOE75478.1 hypothetical protein SAMN05720781_1626 [Fibrobacter sp. UWT3]
MGNVFKNCILAACVVAAGASAEGLYLEGSLGIAKADYVEQERPRRLQQAYDHVGECLGIEGCEDTGPSGEYAPRDKVEYVGYGPVLDLKVGYGWEKLAVFGVIQGTYTEGFHNFDCYVVGEPVEYTGDDDGYAFHNHWVEHEEYIRYSELHSLSTRLFLGGGFTFYPFAKKESPLTGFHAGASFGFSIIETQVDEEKNAVRDRNHGAMEISTLTQSIVFDVGHTWAFNERWNMGVALTAAFENPVESEKEYSMFNLHTVWAGLRFVRK